MFRLLIDENLDHRILRGLRLRLPDLDFVIVQNTDLKGAKDPALLAWAAEQNRILVTHDLKTIPKHAYERVEMGAFMPEVITVPDTLALGRAIAELVTIVESSGQHEWENLIIYLPL
jgi:Domain of unknown function (DUF5615)